jgi:hypothetical protein
LYVSTEYSSEHLSSGSQSEPSVEDSSTGGLCAIAHDGTHDPTGKSTEQHEEAGLEVVSYADQAPPSEQTWFRGTLVTAENAQAIFSPSACIFVAK